MQSFYPPVRDSIWRESTRMVRHSSSTTPKSGFQYPYPTAINVNGPVGGMEYPMIVFCANRRSREGLFGRHDARARPPVVPDDRRNNERLYRGWTRGSTLSSTSTPKYLFPRQAWLRTRGPGGPVGAVRRDGARRAGDHPGGPRHAGVIGASRLQQTGDRLVPAGATPSSIRRASISPSVSTSDAGRSSTHAGRLLPLMNDGGGEDLSYFWRGWFFRTDVVDQAVDSVLTRRDSSGTSLTGVFLSSPGGLPMPVDLRLTFADGSVENARLPV